MHARKQYFIFTFGPTILFLLLNERILFLLLNEEPNITVLPYSRKQE